MMYINGISALLPHLIQEGGICIGRAEEPLYDGVITPAQIRRMSRLLRMGTYTGLKAMEDAQLKQVDAIITSTAYGANEDTMKFLDSLNAETGTGSPTSFIQSTHNVLGGQLALALGCTGYNMTYSQRGFSFESALMDAKLLLGKECSTILCVASDELPISIHQIINNIGTRNNDSTESEMYGSFVISNQPSEHSYATVREIILEPFDKAVFEGKVIPLIEKYGLTAENTAVISHYDPDLFLSNLVAGASVENLAKETGTLRVFTAAAMYKACMALKESSSLQNVLIVAKENDSYFRCLLLQKSL